MKKVLSLVLVFALALTMGLVAFAETEDRVTISVMGVDWGYGPSADSAMERYWEDLFDVNMDIEWVNYNDYNEKVNAMIIAGSQPDVIQVNKNDGAYYYPVFTQAIDNGQFLDLTPYLYGEDGLIAGNAVFQGWSQSMWDQATYKGGIYILPRSKAEIAQQSGITVRRDLMKKYGFEDEPETMEELKDWLIALSNAATEGEGEKIYALDFYGDIINNARTTAFAVAFTGQMDWGYDEDGNFEYICFDKNYINFLNWMKDLYDAGVLDPEFALSNSDTSKWKGGRSVAYLTAWYNWNQSADLVTNRIFDKVCPDTYEAWCLMPVEGDNGIVISANSSDIDSCIAISARVAEDEAKLAKIFQVFCATEEEYPGYNLVMSDGVEGIHYAVLEDGSLDKKGPDNVYGQARTEGYVGAWNQIFLKTDADQITSKFMRSGAQRASDENIQRARDIRAVLAAYLDETGLGFSNQNKFSATYNESWTNIVSDTNANITKYIMGEISADEWNAFVESVVNGADYQAIIAEYAAN
ncbi:MAG: extracellular solute-binding protein [Clostridiales bacterium]|nr:extracellular solute-binding protein [Clostridiales bacterium]